MPKVNAVIFWTQNIIFFKVSWYLLTSAYSMQYNIKLQNYNAKSAKTMHKSFSQCSLLLWYFLCFERENWSMFCKENTQYIYERLYFVTVVFSIYLCSAGQRKKINEKAHDDLICYTLSGCYLKPGLKQAF